MAVRIPVFCHLMAVSTVSLGRSASKHHVTKSCAFKERKTVKEVTACDARTLVSSVLLDVRKMLTKSEDLDMSSRNGAQEFKQ